jgi:hypothetical protein
MKILVLTMHGFSNGGYFLILGFLSLIGSMAFWFRDVISEGAIPVILFMLAVLLNIIGIMPVGVDACLLIVTPVKIYKNADNQKNQIFLDNKGKSGIYMWTNLLNLKKYVGSSMYLRKRLAQYFNANFFS